MFSVFALKVNAQQSSVDWSMFRADPSHSGAGTGNTALNPTLIWKYTTGKYIASSPAVVGGIVFIGSGDGNVYALNATNGASIWNNSIGVVEMSSPAVVNGVVYIGSLDKNLYALNATNGDKLWNYTTSAEVRASPVFRLL